MKLIKRKEIINITFKHNHAALLHIYIKKQVRSSRGMQEHVLSKRSLLLRDQGN